jgi:apolipoprotein D and lipocalin family protein
MALTSTLSPTAPLPTPPAALPDPGPTASLDERIQAAESRLVQREQDLVQRWHHLTRRVRLSLSPRRWAVPAAIGAASLVGLWWLLRPSARASALRHRPESAASVRSAHGRGRPLWLRGLVLLWPMLPASLRSLLSPGATAAVMTFGLPLADRLFGEDDGGAHRHAPLQTMPHVDLQRYAGTWHEIARLPAAFEAVCAGQPSATYQPLPGGALRVVNRCRGHDGAWREVEGVASVQPKSGNARLEVSFWPVWLRWLPMAWAPYSILFVDGDYEVAVVGHPNRRALWLLSRQPRLEPAQVETLVHIAASQGFPVERLQYAHER